MKTLTNILAASAFAARLPRIRYGHEEAVWQGIPWLGPILDSLFR
jgi:hypothetical protein